MWKKIYEHLKVKGIDVYSPSQHKGLCKSSYVVLRDGITEGMVGTNKVGYSVIEVMLVHPVNKYSSLGDYRKLVQDHMNELNFIRKTGFISDVFVQDEKQAYSQVLQYQIMKRL